MEISMKQMRRYQTPEDIAANAAIGRKKRNYINNRDFYDEMTLYIKALRRSKRERAEPPRISEYIGECIQLLCNKMITRPNFSGYSWREEMVLDAMEDCIKAVDNFKPNTTQHNPFGYFSRIAWNAMLRRIADEKKETYKKHKNMQHVIGLQDFLTELGVNKTGSDDKSNDVIKNFEDKAAEQKAKRKKKLIEKLKGKKIKVKKVKVKKGKKK